MAKEDSKPQTILGRLETIPFSRFHVILLSLVFTAVAFDNMDQVTLSSSTSLMCFSSQYCLKRLIPFS